MGKKVAIIGAGITGLSLAYFLKFKQGGVDFTLFEEKEKVGGWVQSDHAAPYFFESGPRSFRIKDANDAIDLIYELQLENEIIFASEDAKNRFLLKSGTLKKAPNSLFELLTSSLSRPHVFTLLKEVFTKKTNVLDESVASFFTRHFSKSFTDQFIDPLVKGIYGAEIDELSINGAFPSIFQMDQQYGSLIKGAIFSRGERKQLPKVFQGHEIFTLKNGLSSLITTLEEKVKDDLSLNSKVKSLQFTDSKVVIESSNGKEVFDEVISTLPASKLATLIAEGEFKEHLKTFKTTSLHVVHLVYKSLNNNSLSGFGYLVPSMEKENVLGVIFDSSVFKEQNKGDEIRLTVMLNSKVEDPLNEATEHVKKILHLEKPIFSKLKSAKEAIPFYSVGYPAWKEKAIQLAPKTLRLLGTSFHGVSLNQCIFNAKDLFLF